MTWCYWKEWGTKTRVSVWLQNHTTLVFIPHSCVQSTVLEISCPSANSSLVNTKNMKVRCSLVCFIKW